MSTCKASRSNPKKAALIFCAMSLLATASPVLAQTYVVLYTFTGGADGGFPNQNLVSDAAGNLYGVTGAGGASNLGTVFKLDPAGAETVLHSFSGPDGSAPIGTLVRDAAGNLYGTTYQGGASNQGTIFKVDSSGTETVLYSFTNGTDGSNPSEGLVMDAAGNLYGIVENCALPQFPGCGGVYKLDPNGNFSMLHYFDAVGPENGAQPMGSLILDAAGNLYGTARTGGPANAGVIFKIDPSGAETVVHNFTGTPDGAAPFAGLVQDKAGNFFGTTWGGGASGNGTVFRVDTAGTETVLYSFPGDKGGSHPDATLALDNDGNLYGTTVFGGPTPSPCSGGCGVLFKLSPAAKETVLYNFGARLSQDVGVILDSKNNLYGTDGWSEVVYEIQVVPPDFSLSSLDLAPATVSPGASATSTIGIPADPRFTGSVALTCSVQPVPALAPTCSINPNSIGPGGSATLTVMTTAPSATLHPALGATQLYALWMPVVGVIGLGVGLGSKQQNRWTERLLTLLLISALLAVLAIEIACSGGSSSNGGGSKGTPAGAYTITVTGTSGSLQHSTTATLNVQ